jgi:hypothetical protein
VGVWDHEEHSCSLEERFKILNKDWQLVAEHVKTRTATQCRTHFQKWEMKQK